MSSIDEAIRAIHEARPRNVVVMTGAGVSADSGIPTFRGAGRCTFAIPARAAEATPAIVEALVEVRS
jgi:NAD-dependent SIR2 family protein deacetylase